MLYLEYRVCWNFPIIRTRKWKYPDQSQIGRKAWFVNQKVLIFNFLFELNIYFQAYMSMSTLWIYFLGVNYFYFFKLIFILVKNYQIFSTSSDLLLHVWLIISAHSKNRNYFIWLHKYLFALTLLDYNYQKCLNKIIRNFAILFIR